VYPDLLSFAPIQSYGAMLLLAWTVGWWLARRRARSVGIRAWHVDWLAPLLLLGCGLGARLAGRCCQMLFDGNVNDRVLFGGALFAVAIALVYANVARIPVGRLGDTFAPALTLGIVLLRVGCFLGGCCWGDICASPERLKIVGDRAWAEQVQTIPSLCRAGWPLCVRFPAGSPAYYQHLTAGLLTPTSDRSLPVHPVQLYEAGAALALLAVLLSVDGRLRTWGELFLLFVIGYSIIRFNVEWFRADNPLVACHLTLSQWASIGCASLCAAVWHVRRVMALRGHVTLKRWLVCYPPASGASDAPAAGEGH
jgi:phosphatidylglycerol:prolipoprotein diacylglycerol transferase